MATLNIKNFPDELYQQLKIRAASSHRSIAQEVTYMISTSLTPPPRRSLLELEGLGAHLWKDIDAAKYVAEERDSWE